MYDSDSDSFLLIDKFFINTVFRNIINFEPSTSTYKMKKSYANVLLDNFFKYFKYFHILIKLMGSLLEFKKS